MKVLRYFLTLALLMAASVAFAQKARVSGQVTDSQTGEPVAFALALEEGTDNATSTDAEGRYSLNVSPDATILFTMVGYEDTRVQVEGRSIINVEMNMDVNYLDEAVVSALGITRASKSLTYAAQTVSADEIADNRSANMITSLAGKASGVLVTQSAGGMGGSAKISIRGYRSVNSGNQPLYIINGVPMSNSTSVASGFYGGHSEASFDSGDGIGNINPEDIESISILKGASASALYGTEAANGVIIINTKKGSQGKMKITFTNSTTFETAAYGPQLQNTYGESTNFYSWGSKLSSPAASVTDDFFKTAQTYSNSLSIQGGTDANQTYLSYSNTYATSLLDNNGKLNRHNITFRNTTKFAKNLSLDASFQYIHQYMKNRPTLGGQYNNPLFGLYRFPVGQDITPYREEFEVYDPERNLMSQNWIKALDATSDQNPWWVMNRINFEAWRDRIIGSLTLRWDLTPKMYIQARASADYINDRDDHRTSATTPAGLTGSVNGRYTVKQGSNMTAYGDVLYGYNDKWGDFGLNVTVGGSVKYNESYSLGFDSYNNSGGLYYANIFNLANMTIRASAQNWYRDELLAVFGTATASYKDWLFLDITARNDWSSSLAFTKSFKTGFFYPSVGVSAALNEAFNMGPNVDLFKVRASYSVVGNDLPGRITNPLGSVSSTGIISSNTTAPFGDLKPETSGSFEAGIDWRFFNNRLSFDVTYYHTNTKNQLFSLSAPTGSGYTRYYVNSGNIQNQGVEATIGFIPVETKDFVWRSSINLSHNSNKVISLHDEIPEFSINRGENFGYELKLVEGGSYGDVYGRKFARDDNGKLLLDESGLPYKAGTTLDYMGNTQAKLHAGWNNTLQYRNISLSFLIDARFGGKVMALTQSDIDIYGTSLATAQARDKGYVEFEGHKFTDVKGFYERVGGFGGISEYYCLDGTNVRLRELSLGYTIPKKWLGNGKLFEDITVSFIGRNLFFFYKNTPSDPDAQLTVDDNYSGLDIYGTPATRSLGFNLKVRF